MKLALVIEKYDPSGGGAERSTRQIASELVERGNDVTVFCAQCPRDLQADGEIRITRMPKSGKLTAARLSRFSLWAKSQILQGDFDASISMTTTVPATIVQPRSGTAIETMQRNLAIYSPGKRMVKQLANQLSPKKLALIKLEKQTLADPMVQAIAANSNYVARQLADHYQYPSEKVSVIPNAATLPEMSDEQRATWRKQVRDGYQIADDTVVFVFAAMNPLLKGLGPLLIAFERMVAAGMPVVLMLAGKFQKQHAEQADTFGIREQVRFVGPTNDMPKLYAASDVLVHPTFYDPSSKVVIEALMMGIPAISTSYNGASDMIAPEDARPRGEVITNPADHDALAEAMIKMVDPTTRKAFSDATVGLTESLSMKVHVDRLVELLDQVIAKN